MYSTFARKKRKGRGNTLEPGGEASKDRTGPSRVIGYNHGMAETISARLANVVLLEAGGSEVRLGSLWEKNPAVVVFLRHYG